MARKAEAAGIIRSQASISRPLAGPKATKMNAARTPKIRPLNEKALPGTQGSRRGVRTAPERIEIKRARQA